MRVLDSVNFSLNLDGCGYFRNKKNETAETLYV